MEFTVRPTAPGHTWRVTLRSAPILASAALAASIAFGNSAVLEAQTSGLQKINHIVVIYQENWSFDSLYPNFPGANGIDQAEATLQQVDKDGKPYAPLPQPLKVVFSGGGRAAYGVPSLQHFWPVAPPCAIPIAPVKSGYRLY